MPPKQIYIVQPFKRRSGQLEASEAVGCRDEDHAGRQGRAMREHFAGLVFYRIETAAEGDDWIEVEVLATVGDVPAEAA